MLVRTLILAAAMGAAPTVAAAQSDASPLSLSAIEQRLAADGFRIVEIERYPNSVEVKGYDRTGQCIEMYLDPRTGEVLRRERDDDCGRSNNSDDQHRRRGDR